MRLLGGRGADFLGELVDFGDHQRNLAEGNIEIVTEDQALLDHGSALVHVTDGFAGFFLNSLDEFGNFFGGLGGFFGQLADFLGDHGKAQAMLAGASGLNGGVERQEVGLFGEVVDYFDDLANVVGAAAEGADDFGGGLDGGTGAIQAFGSFLHGGDAHFGFFAGTASNIQKHLGSVRHALDGCDHLIDGRGRFGDAGALHLSVLDDALHVDAHFMHGAGDFVDGRGGLHADLGGLVGGAGHLGGTGG